MGRCSQEVGCLHQGFKEELLLVMASLGEDCEGE